MNLRLAPASLRFRLDPAELDRLLAEGRLAGATPLPGGPLHYAVQAGEAGPWRLEGGPGRLALVLPRAELEAHRAALPSREGLSATLAVDGQPLRATLEVDMKQRRRER